MTPIWEEPFRKGVAAFRASNFEVALQYFGGVIQLDGTCYKAYESRAATYEKLGMLRNALRDSRKVIELAPELQNGYARSARLFFNFGKYSAAKYMVHRALERVAEDAPARYRELKALQHAITCAISQSEETKLDDKYFAKFPFSRLPVELVDQVFDHIMQSNRLFPATACLVSSRWRAFTLNRPEYWRYLVLSHRNPVRKMTLWLERSRNRIMELRITSSISLLDLNNALKLCNSEMFKSLKVIDMETGVAEFRHNVTLAALTTPLAPNILDLRGLRLSSGARRTTRPDGLEPHPYSLENVGNLSPLISQTSLSNVSSLVAEYFIVDWKAVAPQLHLLHTLIIKALDLPEHSVLTALLGANTGLQKVVLATENAWEQLPIAIPISNSNILLPKLVHLEFLGPMEVAGLMSDLSVPALVHLYLYGTLSRADSIIEAINPIPTALTEFSIRNCTFTSARIVTFLQHLTKLEKVEITLHGGDMDLVVDVFSQTYREEGEERLRYPWLRHINFSHSPNLNGGPIVRLVKSRAIATTSMGEGPQNPCFTTLEEICIDHCPRIDPSVAEWLRKRVEKVSCVYMTRKEIKRTGRSRFL